MVFLNCPYRETPKNVLKKKPRKNISGVGSSRVRQIYVKARHFCLLVPLVTGPSSCQLPAVKYLPPVFFMADWLMASGQWCFRTPLAEKHQKNVIKNKSRNKMFLSKMVSVFFVEFSTTF
jgi:hypothetical protein